MKTTSPTSIPSLPTAYIADVRQAVEVLRQGGIIIYPTDTI